MISVEILDEGDELCDAEGCVERGIVDVQIREGWVLGHRYARTDTYCRGCAIKLRDALNLEAL